MTKDQKIISAIAHISAILPLGFGFVGPLIVWLAKKDEGGIVAEHAKEALNFQITMIVLNLIAWVLILVLIGFIMLWILGILNFIFVVVAAVKALNGEFFRYPFTIRFI